MKKQLHKVLLRDRTILLSILTFFSFALIAIPQAMAVGPPPPIEPGDCPPEPSDQPPREYDILYGDVNGNGGITPFDAVLILKEVVGLDTIMSPYCPGCDPRAADVSGNGIITSYDASLILLRSVGLLDCFPADPSCREAPQQTAKVSLRVPTLKARYGETVTVSVNLDNAEELLAGQFVLTYDINCLELIRITPEPTEFSEIESAQKEGRSLPSLIASQVRDGKIHFAFANIQAEIAQRTVLKLEFKLNGRIPYKHEIPLTLSQVSFNEKKVPNLYPGAIEILPNRTVVLQNYPNPFNPETWLPYHLARDTSVTIRIYNIRGNLVRTLYLGNQNAGIYVAKDRAAHWDGRDNLGQRVASGVYFYTLQAGDFVATRKMTILK
jgi:hypothetical protein